MSQRHRVEVHGYAANGQNMAQGARSDRAVVKQEEREEREERDFPIGPFALMRVDPSGPNDAQGVFYVLAPKDAAEIEAGDVLEVVATGEADTNGEFFAGAVKTSMGEVAYFRDGPLIAEPIVGKGRLRVLMAGGGRP